MTGKRILDVGCGNGDLLNQIKACGGLGRGVTVSKEQVELVRSRGLKCDQLNFWDIDDEVLGKFDAVIFNGCIEHFMYVESRESCLAKYKKLFSKTKELLDPESSLHRVVITCIHYNEDHKLSLLDLLQGFFLKVCYGGFYPPYKSTLIDSSIDFFDLVTHEIRTDDYRITSDVWWQQIKSRIGVFYLVFIKDLKTTVMQLFLRDPFFLHKFIHVHLESWPHQFRGESSPAVHQWLVFGNHL